MERGVAATLAQLVRLGAGAALFLAKVYLRRRCHPLALCTGGNAVKLPAPLPRLVPPFQPVAMYWIWRMLVRRTTAWLGRPLSFC